MESSKLNLSNDATELFVNWWTSAVQALVDDGYGVEPDRQERKNYVNKLERVGKEVGLDFWECASKYANPIEWKRLTELMQEV